MEKKVLVISHNPFDENTNNGRTLVELFKHQNIESIAQLYLRPGTTNNKYCKTTYSVNEMDILKSLFQFKNPGKIDCYDNNQINRRTEEIYKIGSKKRSIYILIRELVWRLNTWYNKKLKNWLKEFSPDVIFFYAGGSSFSIKVVNKISKFLKIPIVCYFADDYYINHASKHRFFGGLNDYLFRKNFKKLITKSQYICISSMMKDDYEKEFSKKGFCIQTSSSLMPFNQKEHGEKIVMSFLGNISLNRFQSLIDIASIIIENNLPIEFNVYSAEKREWVLDHIRNVEGLNFKGKITYEKVLETMKNSDILVHVEAFDDDSIKAVKYSSSTKIADSLSSNRPLLAYGPHNVASMHYLITNDLAFCATSKEQLKDILEKMCNDKSLLDVYSKKGLSSSKNNHNSKKNSEILISILNESGE